MGWRTVFLSRTPEKAQCVVLLTPEDIPTGTDKKKTGVDFVTPFSGMRRKFLPSIFHHQGFLYDTTS
jgi:hypothetical protein